MEIELLVLKLDDGEEVFAFYEFGRVNKPELLINGNRLKYLLEKNGYKLVKKEG